MSDDDSMYDDDNLLDFEDFPYNEAVSPTRYKSRAFSLALHAHACFPGRLSNAHDALAPFHRLRPRQ